MPLSSLKQKKAIIFDMDGVVIDSEPLHERSSQLVMAQHDFVIDEAVFVDFKGSTDRTILEHLVKENNLDVEVDELLRQKRLTYASLLDELQPIAGVISFINRISDSYRLALTTSASRRNKELAFSKFNLHRFFEVVITSNDITNPKPDPEPYRVTTEQLQLSPADCFVIEDSFNGVRSAAAAGCTVVGITTSFDADALKDAGAHHVINGYDELTHL
ncbi:MAG: HAD family hydrolase [Rhodothermales bacterium]